YACNLILESIWCWMLSHWFLRDYMKELGVGLIRQKMGVMAKPDCVLTLEGQKLNIKTESTLKTTQFSCTLGEKFEETTNDGRKTQMGLRLGRGCIGSASGMGWEGKHNNKKIERWEVTGGVCHE
uniref:Lipocalin/cytosolic fatty-acid binding domain-containing protein n=1 Tax=Sciurus vulgaris TaxID=55149 RepID=A0A8D2JMG3_SCIVU